MTAGYTSAPYYQDASVTLWHGDCLEVLRELPDCSVDAVCTDPPYGLGFMGKEWDATFTPGDSPMRRNAALDAVNAGASRQGGRQRASEDYAKRQARDAREYGEWCEQWAAECLRVLKPGGHLLAFGGTRTYHRLACAVEDAGFEIRDSICWHYGSGFPKSLNVSNDPAFCQCDKGELKNGTAARMEAAERRGTSDSLRTVRSRGEAVAESREATDESVLFVQLPVEDGQRCDPDGESVRLDGAHAAGTVRPGEPGMEGRGDAQAAEGELPGCAVRTLPDGVSGDGEGGRLRHGAPTSGGSVGAALLDADRSRQPHRPRPGEQCPGESGTLAGQRLAQTGRDWPTCGGCGKPRVTAGLGTALKPAHEPIVVGRKSLVGTVAANVLAHGTGALNIDGCRIAGVVPSVPQPILAGQSGHYGSSDGRNGAMSAAPLGRWPANVVLDESQAAALDEQTGTLASGLMRAGITPKGERNTYGQDAASGYVRAADTYGDSGGASRFFPTFRYEAKAATTERPTVDGVLHPTVKPLDLMRWLVRLVTPPGGTVLEPFAGSGTTAEACVIEGFRCIAIEREADYLPLIVARLTKPIECVLDFGTAS